MSNGAIDEVIKVREFQLDAFERLTRLNVEVAKARMDIAERLAKVTEQHIKNKTAGLKLGELRKILKRHNMQFRKATKELRSANYKLKTFRGAQARVAALSLGELLHYTEVGRSWSAMKQVIKLLARYGYIISPLKVKAADRKANHFAHPRDEGATIKDAPSNIKNATTLFLGWAVKNGYVPRIGTPPYKKLVQMLGSINSGFATVMTLQETEAKRLMKWRDDLQSTSWKMVDPLKENENASKAEGSK